MAQLEIRRARIEDLVAAAWRPDDVHIDPELLGRTLTTSHEVWAAFYDGELACVYGVELPSVLLPAHLWLVSTALVEAHPLVFLRQSRLMIERSATRFGPLETLCRLGYKKSANWLRWLGFEPVGELELMGLRMMRYVR